MPGPADLMAQEHYEVAMLAGIAALVASIQRGGLPLDAYPEQADDAAYRAAAGAEFRAWRTHLDALPAQAPPAYRTVHPHLLRWAGELASIGEAYAAGIAVRDLAQIAQAQRRMHQVPALFAAVEEALRQDPGVPGTSV